MRRLLALVAAVTLTAGLGVVAAPPASALSQCDVRVDSQGRMTGSGCLFVRFSLDVSNAPDSVYGTINGVTVDLTGYGSGVSGRFGAKSISVTTGILPPDASGTLGRKSYAMGDGLISGIDCTIGRNWLDTLASVKTGLLGNLTVTDSARGALCLAMVVAADYLDEA